MFERPADPVSQAEACRAATDIMKKFSFDAVCYPNIEVGIGPRRDIIYTKEGLLSSVMSPNSGEGFWREVFRASGFYGANAQVIRREI